MRISGDDEEETDRLVKKLSRGRLSAGGSGAMDNNKDVVGGGVDEKEDVASEEVGDRTSKVDVVADDKEPSESDAAADVEAGNTDGAGGASTVKGNGGAERDSTGSVTDAAAAAAVM